MLSHVCAEIQIPYVRLFSNFVLSIVDRREGTPPRSYAIEKMSTGATLGAQMLWKKQALERLLGLKCQALELKCQALELKFQSEACPRIRFKKCPGQLGTNLHLWEYNFVLFCFMGTCF